MRMGNWQRKLPPTCYQWEPRQCNKNNGFAKLAPVHPDIFLFFFLVWNFHFYPLLIECVSYLLYLLSSRKKQNQFNFILHCIDCATGTQNEYQLMSETIFLLLFFFLHIIFKISLQSIYSLLGSIKKIKLTWDSKSKLRFKSYLWIHNEYLKFLSIHNSNTLATV